MHGSISLANISCFHILSFKKYNVTDTFVSAKFTFKKSNTSEVVHSVLISRVAIFRYELVRVYIVSSFLCKFQFTDEHSGLKTDMSLL